MTLTFSMKFNSFSNAPQTGKILLILQQQDLLKDCTLSGLSIALIKKAAFNKALPCVISLKKKG